MGVGGCDTFAVTPATAALQAQATAGAVAARAQAALAPKTPPVEPSPATPPPFAIQAAFTTRPSYAKPRTHG